MNALKRVMARAPLHFRANRSQAAAPRAQRFLGEAMESRLLLSADLGPVLLGDLTGAVELAPAVWSADRTEAAPSDGPSLGATEQPSAADGMVPFSVTAFAPTASGFNVTFNRALDASALNLYETEAGTLGAPDISFIGSATGTVKGSVVANGDTLRFVARGGVLAPDVYTVTLRSASDGFKDAGGGLLDGNQDGIAGGDYRNTFNVPLFSAASRVIGIADFARGPGQAANNVAVILSNGAGVTSASLVLNYDPALLNIIGVNAGSALVPESSVRAESPSPGQLRLVVNAAAGIGPGVVEIAQINAIVPDGTGYGSAQWLDIAEVSLNNGAIPVLDDDAVHVAAYFGDTTGNRGYSALDGQRALRVAAGLDSGFAAYPAIDPLIIGDITGNGQISALDGTRILQFVAGIPTPQIPPLPRTVRWVNPSGGFWDVAANWQDGILPGVNDEVIIDLPSHQTITFRSAAVTVKKLSSSASLALTGGVLQVNTTAQIDGEFTIGNGATLRNATLSAGASGFAARVVSAANFDHVLLKGKLTIEDGARLQVQNQLTLEAGRITLASRGNATALIFEGDQTLGGSGEIFFGGSSPDIGNAVDGTGNLTIGALIQIRGTESGAIGDAFVNESIVLHGSLFAEAPGETIVLGGANTQVFGQLRAANGGTIRLDDTISFQDSGGFSASGGDVILAGTLDNTGKTLKLGAFNGSLLSNNGTIKGGRIESQGSGALVLQSSLTLDGVTLAGNYEIFDGTEMLVRNGLTLDFAQLAFFDESATAAPARLQFLDGSTLGGTGEIVFGGSGDANLLASASGQTLTIGSNIMIHGSRGGVIGGPGNLLTQATIFASAELADITLSGSMVENHGTLIATNGGDFSVAGHFINAGTIDLRGSASRLTGSSGILQTGGSIFLAGATLAIANVILDGGLLAGFGTVEGSIINNAELFVGSFIAPGVLHVRGAYMQSNSGVLSVKIGGATIGTQYDRLQIAETAHLDGLLSVLLTNNFVPELGQNFAVVTYAGRGTTTFAGISGLDLGAGRRFNPIYNAVDLTLSVVAGTAPVMTEDSGHLATDLPEPASPFPTASRGYLGGLEDFGVVDLELSDSLTHSTGKKWRFYSMLA